MECPDGSSCVRVTCRFWHRCTGGGCSCRGALKPISDFGTKCLGTKRKMSCNIMTEYRKVSNAASSAATSKAKKQKAIEYEEQTFGDAVHLSTAAQQSAGQQCIDVIQERIEEYELQYPKGFLLMIYGTSTGSGSIVHEGKMQLTSRGYSIPPIVDANGEAIHYGLQGSQGPGGVSVYDCGPSAVLSKVVETAAQTHFTPICDASDGTMPRTWIRIGAGAPKGIGPYHVCIRVMPLPLPHGWHRRF